MGKAWKSGWLAVVLVACAMPRGDQEVIGSATEALEAYCAAPWPGVATFEDPSAPGARFDLSDDDIISSTGVDVCFQSEGLPGGWPDNQCFYMVGYISQVAIDHGHAVASYANRVQFYREYESSGFTVWGQSDAYEGAPGIAFGHSVAMGGGRAAASAPYAVINGVTVGRVHVYEWSEVGQAWDLETIITPPAGFPANGKFGSRVAIDGDLLVIAAEDGHPTVPGAGVVFTYKRVDDVWTLDATSLSLGIANDSFGSELRLNNGSLLVMSTMGSLNEAFAYRRTSAGGWALNLHPAFTNVARIDLTDHRALIALTTGVSHVWHRVGTAWQSEGQIGGGTGTLLDVAIDSTLIVVQKGLGAPTYNRPLRFYETVAGDTDGDGALDGCDNCEFVSNPDQLDRNRNNVGDACDGPQISDL